MINLKRRSRTHAHAHARTHTRTRNERGAGGNESSFKTCPSHGKAKLLHPLNVSSFSNNAPELKRQHSRWFQVSVCLHPSVALSSPHKTRDHPAPSLFALQESFPSEEGVGGEALHRISTLNYLKKPTARRMKTCSRGSVHRRGGWGGWGSYCIVYQY